MKILSGSQIREADTRTIEKEQISSEMLMERAGIQLFNWLHERLQGAPVSIQLFCGIGNNGGDGLVLARHLVEHGYHVEVHLVDYSDKRSKDFLLNLDRIKERKIWPHVINKGSAMPQIHPDDIVVDAIFGTGLNRSPEAWVVSLMQFLNNSKAFILSIDIPSGLLIDKAFENPKGIIKAHFVLTFQHPKLVFFLPQTGLYCEQWVVLDIGLDPEYLSELDVDFELVENRDVYSWYIPRKKFTHKGTYGHALVIGGSYGKIGAVILAAKACLRAGSGLVTVFLPKCGYIPIQSAVPEVMAITDKDENMLTNLSFELKPNVVAIGVGIGTAATTAKAFAAFLKENTAPLVIDADGLNLLAKQKSLLKELPPKSILTPHPKELERLIGSWKDDFEKLSIAKEFSKNHDCILVLKGAHTITIYKDSGFVNSTGNPGMATAGSGDVLTGIITALVAQGYEHLKAAILGVYLHGLAGDLSIKDSSPEALIASDIIEKMGKAITDLFYADSLISTDENAKE
jgi:hydroxyethylthiazole kinase-like uncharacterized protein yjeF